MISITNRREGLLHNYRSANVQNTEFRGHSKVNAKLFPALPLFVFVVQAAVRY